jgi:hypothetical protein
VGSNQSNSLVSYIWLWNCNGSFFGGVLLRNHSDLYVLFSRLFPRSDNWKKWIDYASIEVLRNKTALGSFIHSFLTIMAVSIIHEWGSFRFSVASFQSQTLIEPLMTYQTKTTFPVNKALLIYLLGLTWKVNHSTIHQYSEGSFQSFEWYTVRSHFSLQPRFSIILYNPWFLPFSKEVIWLTFPF